MAEQFDYWTCPGCGNGWDEVPLGHMWSLGFSLKTGERGEYTCTNLELGDGEQALREYMELGRRVAGEVGL